MYGTTYCNYVVHDVYSVWEVHRGPFKGPTSNTNNYRLAMLFEKSYGTSTTY